VAIRKELTIEHGFSQAEITGAVKTTLQSLWGGKESSPGVFTSDIGMTLWSFGTLFTVDLAEAGVIKIASETKLPTALVDFGTNRGNIDKFLRALKETLAANGLADAKPEAYSLLAAAGNAQVRDASSRREGISVILLVAIIAAVLVGIAIACIVVYLAGAIFIGSIG
jgi:hypothetical protein